MTDADAPVPPDDAAVSRKKPARRRLGFMRGQFTVPDDFGWLGRAEIERSFAGDEPPDR